VPFNHNALLLIVPSPFVLISFLCFYTDDNAGDESKMNTIKISSGSANCIKCGSPFQKVEEIKDVAISNIFNNTHKGETDAAKAV